MFTKWTLHEHFLHIISFSKYFYYIWVINIHLKSMIFNFFSLNAKGLLGNMFQGEIFRQLMWHVHLGLVDVWVVK